jgi:hypothetical protein
MSKKHSKDFEYGRLGHNNASLLDPFPASPVHAQECETCDGMDKGKSGFCLAHRRAWISEADRDDPMAKLILALADQPGVRMMGPMRPRNTPLDPGGGKRSH